jgi:hypothetical protein
LPRSLYDQYLQRQHYRHVGLDYGSRWISERFRTFTEEELRYVGPGGFVINVHQGRIAVAGADERGTLQGVVRYLEDHGMKFFEPHRIKVPDLRGDLLHELYLPDWPYFRGRQSAIASLPERFNPSGSSVSAPAAAANKEEIASADALAETIKNLARAGKTEAPTSVEEQAARSPLSRYTAARLFWDPTTDASRLIREFLE